MTLQDSSRVDIGAVLAKSGPGRSQASYDKNETVFSQGDPANAIYYIQSGIVLLKVLSSQGKEAIIATLSAGDFFGEGCLAGQPRRTTTAATMSDCSLVRVEGSSMVRLLQDEPALAAPFIQYLLSRNLRTEEDLVDHFFNSSEKRLARVLLRIASFAKPGQPDQALPRVTQSTLAEIVGTTRARISFFMNRFRKLGYIDYNPGLRVYNSLEHFVAQPEPGMAMKAAAAGQSIPALDACPPWERSERRASVYARCSGD